MAAFTCEIQAVETFMQETKERERDLDVGAAPSHLTFNEWRNMIMMQAAAACNSSHRMIIRFLNYR